MANAHTTDEPRLRFFVARSTPNSVRAEQNLRAALAKIRTPSLQIDLEVIDVFSDPHQALAHGIIVTPTLISMGPSGRAMLVGDLADDEVLHHFLKDFGASLG